MLTNRPNHPTHLRIVVVGCLIGKTRVAKGAVNALYRQQKLTLFHWVLDGGAKTDIFGLYGHKVKLHRLAKHALRL